MGDSRGGENMLRKRFKRRRKATPVRREKPIRKRTASKKSRQKTDAAEFKIKEAGSNE